MTPFPRNPVRCPQGEPQTVKSLLGALIDRVEVEAATRSSPEGDSYFFEASKYGLVPEA